MNKPVAQVLPVGGGYTSAHRGLVVYEDGSRAFAKQGADAQTQQWLEAELRIYRAIEAPFMPRLLGVDHANEYTTLLVEDLSHLMQPPPWSSFETSSSVQLFAQLAACPAPALLADFDQAQVDKLMQRYVWVCEHADQVAAVNVPGASWAAGHLDEMYARASRLPFAGDQLLHLDVRSDNLFFRPDGQAILIDWNWAQRGNSLLDQALFATRTAAEGAADAPWQLGLDEQAGDFALLLCGMWLYQLTCNKAEVSNARQQLQRGCLAQALSWAQHRW